MARVPATSAVGSFAKLGAEAATSLLGLAPDARRDAWVALGFLAVCAASNLLGVRASARQQALVTAAKYGGVLLLALVGLCAAVPAAGVAVPVDAPPFATAATWGGCFAALAMMRGNRSSNYPTYHLADGRLRVATTEPDEAGDAALGARAAALAAAVLAS